MFSTQKLYCCICGREMEVSVNTEWHGFDKAVCGARCFYEKEWRYYLSVMNKPYHEDTRLYDENGRPKK